MEDWNGNDVEIWGKVEDYFQLKYRVIEVCYSNGRTGDTGSN